MKNVLKDYLIRFGSLKQGTHQFNFEIGDKFFSCFEFSEVKKGNLKATVALEKQSTMLVFHINISGTVNVPCDRCNEPFDLPLSAEERLIVKFDNEAYDSTDEIVVLPHHEYEYNLASQLYEFIILNVPYQRQHPDGECDEEVASLIEEGEFNDPDLDEEELDPRWQALQELKNKK